MSDVSVFELRALAGQDANIEQLQQVRDSLRDGYALERADGTAWLLVGWTGALDRARAWVDEDGDAVPLPDH